MKVLTGTKINSKTNERDPLQAYENKFELEGTVIRNDHHFTEV